MAFSNCISPLTSFVIFCFVLTNVQASPPWHGEKQAGRGAALSLHLCPYPLKSKTSAVKPWLLRGDVFGKSVT